MKKYICILCLALWGCGAQDQHTQDPTEEVVTDTVDSDTSPKTKPFEIIPHGPVSWLGMWMGMDSAEAASEQEWLWKHQILGEPGRARDETGAVRNGYRYHLRSPDLIAKGFLISEYYQGKLGMLDLYFYEGVGSRKRLYDHVKNIYGPADVEKEGDMIWLRGGDQIRVTDPDPYGRHRIFWLDGEYLSHINNLDAQEDEPNRAVEESHKSVSTTPRPNFSWLGLQVGMDSLSAQREINALLGEEILGEKVPLIQKDGEELTGYSYHLRAQDLNAEAVCDIRYAQGRLKLIDLYFLSGVDHEDQLYDYLAGIYGPTGIYKDWAHIWIQENSQMRATRKDDMGRFHIFWEYFGEE